MVFPIDNHYWTSHVSTDAERAKITV